MRVSVTTLAPISCALHLHWAPFMMTTSIVSAIVDTHGGWNDVVMPIPSENNTEIRSQATKMLNRVVGNQVKVY